MLRFQDFALAPGLRLTATVERGRLQAVHFPSDDLPSDFLIRYLTNLSAPQDGDLLLPELLDASGQPRSLHSLSRSQIRTFLCRTVGLVLADGGLLDELSVRENLLLSFHYHQRWPHPPEAPLTTLVQRLEVLLDRPLQRAELDPLPGDLTEAERRLWGLLKTLVREPQLVVYAGLFAGLAPANQAHLGAIITRYLARYPTSAHLLLIASDPDLRRLLGSSYHDLNSPPVVPDALHPA